MDWDLVYFRLLTYFQIPGIVLLQGLTLAELNVDPPEEKWVGTVDSDFASALTVLLATSTVYELGYTCIRTYQCDRINLSARETISDYAWLIIKLLKSIVFSTFAAATVTGDELLSLMAVGAFPVFLGIEVIWDVNKLALDAEKLQKKLEAITISNANIQQQAEATDQQTLPEALSYRAQMRRAVIRVCETLAVLPFTIGTFIEKDAVVSVGAGLIAGAFTTFGFNEVYSAKQQAENNAGRIEEVEDEEMQQLAGERN